MWRVHKVAKVDGATRLVLACHSKSSSTKRPNRSSVSRETGVSASAAALSLARSGFVGLLREVVGGGLAALIEPPSPTRSTRTRQIPGKVWDCYVSRETPAPTRRQRRRRSPFSGALPAEDTQ